MTDHPSHPDQLAADDEGWQQAVDWHAGYDAGQRRAEQKLSRIRELLTFLNANDPTFREQHERYFLRALGEPDR